MRTAGATVVTGLALGFEEAFGRRDPPPVIAPDRRDEPLREEIALYFHAEVPEATLVLIRHA